MSNSSWEGVTDAFNRGVEDFEKDIYNLPDVPFFQLKTQEEREYWQGWIYGRGHKKYLEELDNKGCIENVRK